jgi:hypothetical protein
MYQIPGMGGVNFRMTIAKINSAPSTYSQLALKNKIDSGTFNFRRPLKSFRAIELASGEQGLVARHHN